MKTRNYLLIIALFCSVILKAQPAGSRLKYDLTKDKVLYTVGYAHLDTEWNWDYPTTINEYIKNIMLENFHLFEKYPDYVFNFTGSRRYKMMKEYYPELFPKVKEYINKGRWFVSGSSVDEGEVNISSSESVIRQVLYGNNYFRSEFGKESMDYMLPDCFGFIANMPSIWNHCGLLGFSTQKLTWHSAAGIPFNIGIWNGPDGKGIIAALNATDYTGHVKSRLDLDINWNERLDGNFKKYGYAFDYRYYGVGDQGGAPRERDVLNATESLRNNDSKFKVVLTSSDQIYKDITPEIRKKLPVYFGDLLLIEHSAGSMTSQSYMKRLNRKNEMLAQASEQLASVAGWINGTPYPKEKLNNAWDLVLGSQFHDILPGTSIPKAYEYSWNDEFIASNSFAEVLKNSAGIVSKNMDTRAEGRSLIVYNPVARNREDVVTAEMEYADVPSKIEVRDAKGKIVPSQVIGRNGNKLKFIFLAKVPSVGMTVYDVIEKTDNTILKTSLLAKDNQLENEFYKITVDQNGDFSSIFDKKASKELLSGPARLEFLHEKPADWPAWNMDWKDRQNPPIDFMNKEVSVRIAEQGPVRVALEIKRKGMNSEITQVVSLSAGEAGKRIEVANIIDWQSTGVSLKASFPLTVKNEMATYNLGVGTIQRSTNNNLKFEVPSKEWFDLTDQKESYGVSILEDCKYGSDKPDDHTLRLTLMYTPASDRRYLPQTSQDWGVHEFKYGIFGHRGNWNESQWQGKYLNQPLMAFEAPKHNGKSGKETSFLQINQPQVGLMAFKKMEDGEYYIVRVNELYGKDLKEAKIIFPGKIIDAYEVNGQEQKIGGADFSNGILKFDLSHYTIRSFAVKFASEQNSGPLQAYVDLPYDVDAFSFDSNRDDANFDGRLSIPADLIGKEIVSENIRFKMGNTADRENNAINCTGQKITLPDGNFTKICILASAKTATSGVFFTDDQAHTLNIQKWTGYIGQFYNRKFALDLVTVTGIDTPYVLKDNIAWFASHRHLAYPSKNDAYQYSYIYKYEISIPKGAKTLTLPDNDKIRVFAVTIAAPESDDVTPVQPLNDDFANSKSVAVR